MGHRKHRVAFGTNPMHTAVKMAVERYVNRPKRPRKTTWYPSVQSLFKAERKIRRG